ncbi:2-C-methyl-D-erythritol 4-phosphate cytidylyltransferase [Clostridium sediminicola]|uniref:2-C-methyl-D-erythritol 4-phosphate cytidylyltransferase n=1 Tax=Clostridium sediminicola TaxID=3114879 RepID=UPI0031F26DFA
MKNCAVIVAAGKGTRMKADVSKQFLCIKNKPILYYTLKVFEENDLVDDIILVLAECEIKFCRENIIEKYNFKKIKQIVAGGKTRQESVLNGLYAAHGSDIVLIHDGARPFIDNEIISDGIKFALLYGGAACGVTPKDTIKSRSENGFSESTLERNKLFCVQTPQCFKYDIILKCHVNALKQKVIGTDDTMIAEYYSENVYLYQGSYDNIKITTPEDLFIAEKLIEHT